MICLRNKGSRLAGLLFLAGFFTGLGFEAAGGQINPGIGGCFGLGLDGTVG